MSGEHYYEFDGENLKIWKEKNVGSIEYNLEIVDCEDSHHGILRNLTGLDGCGWIIQLSDSSKLEPINLALLINFVELPEKIPGQAVLPR